MILLSGHSLTQARRVPLESLSLRLSERESTASMVPVTMDGIGIDSWLMDDTEPGRGIVWRVRSIQTAYATATPTVQLEHAVNCLKDRILFGEHDAAAMGGSDTVTAEQAIRYALQRQSDWRLGRCEFLFSAPYKFNGESIYDAIKKVTDTLDGAWWDLDTSTYPFVINIIRKPAGAACELRPGRNLSALSRQIDTSGMITRFYPIGKDDLHIPTEYVSRNEAAYGVRERVEVDQEIETEEELTSWANEALRKHAQPVVTITAEGLELAEATGESLDRLTLGRICRIPLQEFGTIIEERITQIEYSDKIREPEKVRITMSNQETDRSILHLIAEEMKTGGGRGGRGARASGRQNREDHAWIEDSATHVALVAEKIIGRDAQGKPNWVRLSRLQVDENGIYGEVQGVQNDIQVASTRIEQNENQITLEAKRFDDGQAKLTAKIQVEADRITAEVKNRQQQGETLSSRITQTAGQITAEVNRASAAEGQLSSRITVNANGIRTKVEKNGVISAINQTAESVTISASRINLSGYVTASQLNTTSGRIDNLMSGNTAASKIVCDDLRLPIAFYYHGNRYTEFFSSTEKKFLLGRS